MEKENSDLMTEFLGNVFFQYKSIVVGAIKNVTFRRILLVLDSFSFWAVLGYQKGPFRGLAEKRQLELMYEY